MYEDKKPLDEGKRDAKSPTQPEVKQKRVIEPPIALKTCTINLEGCTVELVEGQFIHGLTRRERDHLKFHGFIK